MSEKPNLFPEPAPGRLRPPAEPIVRSARIEGPYRFELIRAWGNGPRIAIAGCNPSTADATRDDPTMLREMAFAARWGFGSLVKINVYPFIAARIPDLNAWRSGDPDRFATAMEENKRACAAAIVGTTKCWAAWGRHVATDDLQRWLGYIRCFVNPAPAWSCLGTNHDGSPRHTLARGRHRIADDAVLTRWSRGSRSKPQIPGSQGESYDRRTQPKSRHMPGQGSDWKDMS